MKIEFLNKWNHWTTPFHLSGRFPVVSYSMVRRDNRAGAELIIFGFGIIIWGRKITIN